MTTKSFDLKIELERLIRLEVSGLVSDRLREEIYAKALLFLVIEAEAAKKRMEELETLRAGRVYCICEKSWGE